MSTEKRGETFVMRDPDSGSPIDFTSFLLGLASSALIHLGITPNPETGSSSVDLTAARQTLDVLSMLHDKTKGNLTAEEERFFGALLADLRLKFVEATRK